MATVPDIIGDLGSSNSLPVPVVENTLTRVSLGPNWVSVDAAAVLRSPLGQSIKLSSSRAYSPDKAGDTGSVTLYADYTEQKAIQDFRFLVSRVLELLREEEEEEEDDEYGAHVPTESAMRKVLSTLSEAYYDFQTVFPRAAVSVSPSGGIRVQWIYADSSVRLVIPGLPPEEGYIYFEHDDNYDIKSVSARNLANRISWLQRICRNAETDGR